MEGAGINDPLKTRLLIADDHDLLRQGMRIVLSLEPDLEIVGEAANGREALELCQELDPDLVLMDISMPEMDGLEATRAIKEIRPGISVLVVTTHLNPDYLLQAVKAGAAGYVLKMSRKEEIVDAIRSVIRGEFPFDQELSIDLLRQLAHEEGPGTAPPAANSHKAPRGTLTPREIDVLRLLALGKTNRQIAQEIHLSLSTVKGHLERLISKLGVSDRTQAAVKAVELGLVVPVPKED